MTKPRIVIIEDSVAQQQALLLGLELRGFEAHAATSVAHARSLFRELRGGIDVVVLDMRLELWADAVDEDGVAITGAELGQEIKEAQAASPPELLILSSYQQVDYYRWAIKLGAAAYLDKIKESEEGNLVRHIRALALRRLLSITRSEIAEYLQQLSLEGCSPEDALARFCEDVLCHELSKTLGAPFSVLLTTRGGTYCYTGVGAGPAGPHGVYDTLQEVILGAGKPGTPQMIELSRLLAADGTTGRSELGRLTRFEGAAGLPLTVGAGGKLTLLVLPSTEESPLAEDPWALALVLAEYLRGTVLDHYLPLLARHAASRTHLEALAKYEETIEDFPGNEVAHIRRGAALREIGQLDDALAQYEETIQRFPDSEVAQVGRGAVLCELGRLDDALAQYEETIQRFPDSEVAQVGRGSVLCELGRLADALAQYEETIQRFPDSEFAQVGRGSALCELGRLEDALAQYEETIQRSPNNQCAFLGRGDVLRELGQLDDALAQHEEMIQRSPDNVAAYNSRGEVLRELARLDDALAHYEETIRRFPDNEVAYVGRGDVLRGMGRLDDALIQHEETIQRSPNNAAAYGGRAEVLRDLGRLDDALVQYEEMTQRFPSNQTAHVGRAEALCDLGRLADALGQYERNIQRFPHDVHSYNGRIAVLRRLGRHDEAFLQYEALLAQFPPDTVARGGRAALLPQADWLESTARHVIAERKDGPIQARSSLRKAMQLDPGRTERIREEFGFLCDFDVASEPGREQGPEHTSRSEWRRLMWRVLSARNIHPLPSSQTSHTIEPGTEERSEDEISSTTARDQDGVAPEQKGEVLEQAVLSLLSDFFRIEAQQTETILHKLRQQNRGTQFGHDISFECVLPWNANVRCHVECKNLKKKITLAHVAEKVAAQHIHDPHIDHWILISPRANPTNELNHVLEQWRLQSPYPFTIQVWCPDTQVEEFFGLRPPLYNMFFEAPDGALHPRDWTAKQRREVYARWCERLAPPLRLGPGWESYVKEPLFLCLKKEQHHILTALFEHHVSMLGLNEAGVPLGQPLEHSVRDWLANEEVPVCFLLGDFGDGKTVFTYTLARRLLADYACDPATGWIPVRFALRDYDAAGDAREFLRRRLADFGADLADWNRLRQGQRLLVILDGFDEMTRRLDPDSVAANIRALRSCYDEFEGAKLLITSRTHFFENRRDKQRLLNWLGQPLVLRLAPIPRRVATEHLQKCVTDAEESETLATILNMHDPIGLASKPLFLDMLTNTLHNLPPQLDELTLYDKYVRDCLLRKIDQLEQDEGTLHLPKELISNLLTILEDVAIELQGAESGYVSLTKYVEGRQRRLVEMLWKSSEGDEWVAEAQHQTTRMEQDARARVGVRSLLSRVDTPDMDEEWTVDFCHRSIREYFVARGLLRALRNTPERAEKLLGHVPLSHEILDFSAGMLRRDDGAKWRHVLLRLIERAGRGEDTGRLGGRAVTLLYRLTGELPDSNWTDRALDYADLAGADLSGKDFSRSSFRYANLDNVNFEHAVFSACDFTGVRIEETSAVQSLAVCGSGERILAAYSDGSMREWDLSHPRKNESRIVHSGVRQRIIAMGALATDNIWARVGDNFVLFDQESNRLLRQVGRYPIRTDYAWVSAHADEVIAVSEVNGAQCRAVAIDLEEQQIVRSAGALSASMCERVGLLGFVVNDGDRGLDVIAADSTEPQQSLTLLAKGAICLCVRPMTDTRFLVACGQQDGCVSVWRLDLCNVEWSAVSVTRRSAHHGAVTVVKFLDEARLVSGGDDRRIVVTRFEPGGQGMQGETERVLHLTVRCQGMRIDGLQGTRERTQLEELIKKSEGSLGE